MEESLVLFTCGAFRHHAVKEGVGEKRRFFFLRSPGAAIPAPVSVGETGTSIPGATDTRPSRGMARQSVNSSIQVIFPNRRMKVSRSSPDRGSNSASLT